MDFDLKPQQTSSDTHTDVANQPEVMQHEPVHQPVVVGTRKKKKGKTIFLVLLVVLLIAGAAGGVYWWQDKQASDASAANDAKIQQLEKENADLNTQLHAAKTEADKALAGPTDSTDKIVAAVKAQKYVDIQPFMAEKVQVIIAASEGMGEQTAAEAAKSLDYLKSATGEWDFALSTETLTAYRTGDYGSYFPVGAIVGKSGNDYVVSFTFDSTGKVNGIFMSAKDTLL